MQAPSDFTGRQHAEDDPVGGNRPASPSLARVSERIENDDFEHCAAVFVAHPMLDLAHVGPIVTIHQQRFVSHDVFTLQVIKDNSRGQTTMKGARRIMLRQVEAWHGSLATAKKPN